MFSPFNTSSVMSMGSQSPFSLRIHATCHQGGRKYMEDTFCVSYQRNPISQDIDFVFFGIFDGHGGRDAAFYARDHLCENIIRERSFWSKNDDDVLHGIRRGFITTHYDMLKEVDNWPKTATGLPSTSGTTASILFIKNGKYYTGHVGDCKIVLGKSNQLNTKEQLNNSNCESKWYPFSLTKDHKPETPFEKKRIEAAGGQVMNKSGVYRVVWNRPKLGHKGPIRRSTSFDQIPFLAVARSLGDLWSFNPQLNTFIVSPEPDVAVHPIDPSDRCIVLASDGLWNVASTSAAIRLMEDLEVNNDLEEESELIRKSRIFKFNNPSDNCDSPSNLMVRYGLHKWWQSGFRADNTTVLVILFDHRDNNEHHHHNNFESRKYIQNENDFEDEEFLSENELTIYEDSDDDLNHDDGMNDGCDYFTELINENNNCNLNNSHTNLISNSINSNSNLTTLTQAQTGQSNDSLFTYW